MSVAGIIILGGEGVAKLVSEVVQASCFAQSDSGWEASAPVMVYPVAFTILSPSSHSRKCCLFPPLFSTYLLELVIP